MLSLRVNSGCFLMAGPSFDAWRTVDICRMSCDIVYFKSMTSIWLLLKGSNANDRNDAAVHLAS